MDRTYHGRTFRVFSGAETRQIQGHTGAPAIAEAWYWEPADYEGDVLYSNTYADADEAARAAEEAHDAGEWD